MNLQIKLVLFTHHKLCPQARIKSSKMLRFQLDTYTYFLATKLEKKLKDDDRSQMALLANAPHSPSLHFFHKLSQVSLGFISLFQKKGIPLYLLGPLKLKLVRKQVV